MAKLQMALILEVCAEKPGNVTPTHNFSSTRFEDFIASSCALHDVLRRAVERGYQSREKELKLSSIKIGELIHEGVVAMRSVQSGGNTHLGTLMLFIPLAAAVGLGLARDKNLQRLRFHLKNILEYTTVEDAVELYKAISISGAGGLGREKELDVNDENSIKVLKEKQLTFLDIMRYSSDKDRVAQELATGLRICFTEGAPLLIKLSREVKNIREAIVQLYLILLSKYPDTLIARKVGWDRAREVSERAKHVLECGGVLTEEGKKKIAELDSYLRSKGNKLNPGTTADITTTSLAIALLKDNLLLITPSL